MKKNLVNFNNLHEIDKAHGLCSKLWEKAKTIVAGESIDQKIATVRTNINSANSGADNLKKSKM